MKVKAVIFQIIKWEERFDFMLGSIDFGNKPHDLIHLGLAAGYQKPFSVIGGLINKFKSLSNNSKYPIHHITFRDGLAVWIERPHPEYKVGDIIDLEIILHEPSKS